MDGFALVTGAGSGLGEAIVLAYAKEGAKGISLLDINQEAAERTAKLARTTAQNTEFQTIVMKVDVTNEGQVQNAVAATKEAFGRIDYAINSAGLLESEIVPAVNVSLTSYDRINDVNSRGLFICLKAELNAMITQEPLCPLGGRRPAERGSIVNIASAASTISLPGALSYVASKHAVSGMTKSAAADHAKDGIRVNAVAPTFIETPMLVEKMKTTPTEIKDSMYNANPMKRFGFPEEVADVVTFLSSHHASLVTGQTWGVDGGHSII